VAVAEAVGLACRGRDSSKGHWRTFANPILVHRYWHFLIYLFITLLACEVVLTPMPALYSLYSAFIGYLGLAIEATLPIPQIVSNIRTKSCKGFRVSVLASWLAGDFMKMFWFFNATSEIPLGFKLCGIFQMCCDSFLGGQYWFYGAEETILKDHIKHPMTQRSLTPSGRRSPISEKDGRFE
jgi:hypothetical protein